MDNIIYLLFFAGVLFWLFKVKSSPATSIVFSIGTFLVCYFFLNDDSFLLFTLPGGISVYPMDIVAGVLMIGTLLRAGHLMKKLVILKPVLQYIIFSVIILSIIVVSFFLRGKMALNISRIFLASIFAGLYFISFDYDRKTLIEILASYYAIVCVLILATCLRLTGINIMSWLWTSDRVINAPCALIIAIFFIINLWLIANVKIRPAYLIAAFISCILVMIMQHRSVWLGTMAGVLSCGLLSKRKLPLFLFGVSLLWALFLAVYLFPNAAEHYMESFSNSVIKNADEFEGSTGQTRLNRWTRHFDENMDIKTALIGNGFGWKREKYELGIMTVNMHNNYLEILFAGGIAPLTLFVLMNLYLFMAISPGKPAIANLFAIIAVTYNVFSFAYPLMIDYFIFLGIATSVISSKGKELLFTG